MKTLILSLDGKPWLEASSDWYSDVARANLLDGGMAADFDPSGLPLDGLHFLARHYAQRRGRSFSARWAGSFAAEHGIVD